METTSAQLQALRALVGEWTTEATHPMLPSTVARGRSAVEWLEGETFLIVRARNDHPEFPDSISIIGDTGGLRMHYFDSRGGGPDLRADVGWTAVDVQPHGAGLLSARLQAAADLDVQRRRPHHPRRVADLRRRQDLARRPPDHLSAGLRSDRPPDERSIMSTTLIDRVLRDLE
jgi:hypothetical protein